MLTTEFPFELPIGWLDPDGQPHRSGVMRLATAADEIAPLRDPRVQANPGYLLILLLSRVVTQLDGVSSVNPKIIETLYAADLAFLQNMYRRINMSGSNHVRTTCPHCAGEFNVELSNLGESGATL